MPWKQKGEATLCPFSTNEIIVNLLQNHRDFFAHWLPCGSVTLFMNYHLVISFLFCAISVFWQTTSLDASPQKLDAFQDGEWFQYRIHYGFFNASMVELELIADTLNKIPVLHAKGYGKTTGLARLFFKVDDRYESYFGQHDGLPRKFIRDIYEGGYTKDIEIRFDHQAQLAKVHDKKNQKKSQHPIKENVQDLISAFYYLRNFYDTRLLDYGKDILLNMFFDEENYLFKLRFLGRETIDTKFGRINCVKLRPLVQSGRVFSEQESVTLWVSDDENKIPVKIRADLRVGSIDCDLENFKNLRHPFRIKIQ